MANLTDADKKAIKKELANIALICDEISKGIPISKLALSLYNVQNSSSNIHKIIEGNCHG